MRLAIFVFAAVIIAAGIVWTIDSIEYPKWTVEPTVDWKWRSCIIEADWGIYKYCGSPTSYGDALWWAQTKGATKVNP